MKNKIFTGIISAAMLVTLASCEQPLQAQEQVFVSLDINPSIEFILDNENKVVSVRGANEDGQVLLYGENIVGLDINAAIEKITSLAVELGYLSENNKVVSTSVTSIKGKEAADELLDNISTTLTAKAEELGLSVTTDLEGSFSLQRKLVALKEKYPENVAIQNIDINKFKLALSVSESGEISLEDAVELDTEELLAKLQEVNSKVEAYANEAYNFAKAQALKVYEQTVNVARDGVYAAYYLNNIADHPDTFYYGSIYQMYKLTSSGFNAIADAAEYAALLSNQALDETQVATVLEVLNLDATMVAELKDSQGNITLKSIDAYANKMFKNSESSAELEKLKTELSTVLNNTEEVINERLNQLQSEYATEINTLVSTLDSVIATLNAIIIALPENIKTLITAMVNEFMVLIDGIETLIENGITIDEVREYAELMDKKAKEMLNKIEEDLSDEELVEISSMKEKVEKTFISAKEKLEGALNQAKQNAQEYFANLKAKCKVA